MQLMPRFANPKAFMRDLALACALSLALALGLLAITNNPWLALADGLGFAFWQAILIFACAPVVPLAPVTLP